MKPTHYLAQVWSACTTAPTPDAARRRLLREAEHDYLKSLEAAEDHAVQAEAYREQCRMLQSRINRLRTEAAA